MLCNYTITPSVDLTTLGNYIYVTGGITFAEDGLKWTTTKWDGGNGRIQLYSFRNNIASVSNIDDIFFDTPIRLIVTFSN